MQMPFNLLTQRLIELIIDVLGQLFKKRATLFVIFVVHGFTRLENRF